MLRELEEAVQRKFHVPSDVSDTTCVANGWESRLHISQVWNNIGSTLIWIMFNFDFSLPKPVCCESNTFKHKKGDFPLAEWNEISGKRFSRTPLGPGVGFRSCDM